MRVGTDERPFEDGQRVHFDLGDGQTGTGTVITVSRPAMRGYPTQTPPAVPDDWQVLVQPEDAEDSFVVLAGQCRGL